VSRGLQSLLAAQFVSGLADNALLLVAIACVLAEQGEAWLPPLLKLVFTLAYVVLAPFVGPLADRWPKARVMFVANALKALACAAMALGLPALAAFTVAGIGAALYSPAKYGLVTELVPSHRLVVANAWLEVSTVVAILLGTLLGGGLTDQPFVDAASVFVAQGLAVSLAVVLLLYVAAAALNLRVPDSGCRYPPLPWRRQWQGFVEDNRRLWRDPLGQVSLATTTLFWGIGAVLQFIALRWADERLGLALSEAAYLQGLAAVGVIAGAALAGRCVPLRQAPRVLGLGIVLGLLMPVMLVAETVPQGALLLAAIGFAGGFFVVPMNALLQHRGVRLLSAGRSIAVQNFNENASVLVVLAFYTLSMAHGVSLPALLWSAGLAVAGAMALVAFRWRQIDAAAWQCDEAQQASSS
jgi:MFS family permease